MSKLLDRIESPEDLRGLDLPALRQLAQELREEIVETVSVTGGHLGANLGAIEITLALHSVLHTPRDKIIWDVGHQAYAHKILTGRRQVFRTLRQYGGISGFPRRSESPHDAFGTAHAGTSISAALGYCIARDRRGERYAVVTVTGDGALTAGMAFEALNHAGQLKTDLVVILNDNKMSIAPNVGALSEYLTRLRVEPTLQRAKDDLERLLSRIPGIGESVVRVAEHVKDTVRHLLVPGAFFEELGWKYYGPIDGHHIGLLQKVLREAIAQGGPVIIHAITEKGRGYTPAEKDPGRLHAVHGKGPVVISPRSRWPAVPGEKDGRGDAASPAGRNLIPLPPASPAPSTNAPTYSKVFGRTLLEMARQDPRIIAITAAMPDGTGLDEFARELPGQFLDVGIAEQHAVTLAAGLACGGMRPVAAIYSTFLQRAYDQVIHDVCIQDLPVVLALDRAGLVGDDGPTHHGAFDIAYLRTVPNLVVMAPKDEQELRHMLKTALLREGPTALRYPRGKGVGVPLTPPEALPIGRGELLRDGTDVAFVALGPLVYRALEAAAWLGQHGISAAVVNARFVKPLDAELILSVARRTGRVVTVEDGARAGGFGSAVLELLADAGLTGVRVRRLGLPDAFIDHGPVDVLHEEVGLGLGSLVATAAEMVEVAAERVSGGA